MKLDSAISDAIDTILAAHPDQTEMFKHRFRNLVELVLDGNLENSDVQRVMELLQVNVEVDD